MNDELMDLWYWAWQRGQDAALEPPTRLHAAHPTPDSPKDRPLSLHRIGGRRRKHRSAVIVGRPFTREFERYLDNVRPMTPIRRALFALRRRPMPLAFKIVWAIVEGGHRDPGLLRSIMCLPEDLFFRLALVGLRRLRYDTEWEERVA